MSIEDGVQSLESDATLCNDVLLLNVDLANQKHERTIRSEEVSVDPSGAASGGVAGDDNSDAMCLDGNRLSSPMTTSPKYTQTR